MKIYGEVVAEIPDAHELSEEKTIVARLNDEIERLPLLIPDLIDTTKISEGKINFNLAKFDIEELLKERIGEIGRISTHTIRLDSEQLH